MGFLHCKPTIIGYPHLWKAPYVACAHLWRSVPCLAHLDLRSTLTPPRKLKRASMCIADWSEKVTISPFFLAVYLCAFQTFRPPTRSRLLLYMSFDPKLAWKAGKPCRNAGDLKVLEWIAMTLAAHSSSIYVSQNNHAMRPPAGQQAFDMLLGIPVFFVLTRGREWFPSNKWVYHGLSMGCTPNPLINTDQSSRSNVLHWHGTFAISFHVRWSLGIVSHGGHKRRAAEVVVRRSAGHLIALGMPVLRYTLQARVQQDESPSGLRGCFCCPKDGAAHRHSTHLVLPHKILRAMLERKNEKSWNKTSQSSRSTTVNRKTAAM